MWFLRRGSAAEMSLGLLKGRRQRRMALTPITEERRGTPRGGSSNGKNGAGKTWRLLMQLHTSSQVVRDPNKRH